MSTNPDAVFIASAGTPAVLPQQALRERGYAGKIFQTHGIASRSSSISVADVEGAVFAGEAFSIAADLPAEDPFRRSTEEFMAAYKAANGEKPNMFAAHLWDTVALTEKRHPPHSRQQSREQPNFARRCGTHSNRAEHLSQQRAVEHEPGGSQRL